MTAAQFASKVHAKQLRKYSGLPYIFHCAQVAGLVATRPWATADDVNVGFLHDTLEDDTQGIVSPAQLERDFGPAVARDVVGLTNPSKGFPKLPRAERKAMDREHIALLPARLQAIKLIDRYCNLSDMLRDNAPRDFTLLYMRESAALYECLSKGAALDPEIARAYLATLDRLREKHAPRAPSV